MAEEKKQNEYVPILPFDGSYGHRTRMYDEMTYIRDSSLCNKDTVAMESGNVYKFYRCNIQEQKPVGGDINDDDIEDI